MENDALKTDNRKDVEHKKFPCAFFQDSNLSPDAIALGSYIHSFNDDFHINSLTIARRFQWSAQDWNMACIPLIDEGYMKLFWDNEKKESYYNFSITKDF
jgi:hypothetical protein